MSTSGKEEGDLVQEIPYSEPEAIKYAKHDHGGKIVLVPQPSDDPNDPLVSPRLSNPLNPHLEEVLSGYHTDKEMTRTGHCPQRSSSSCACASPASQVK